MEEYVEKVTRNLVRRTSTIASKKYDIGFVVKHCRYETLYRLEPWCSAIYISNMYIKLNSRYLIADYIKNEQQKTPYDLSKRVYSAFKVAPINDIVVEFDADEFKDPTQFEFIARLSEVLSSGEFEVGDHNIDIFNIKIAKL